ncbi:WYL domain-containing protein [Corallibacter vietnamensis]|uniref:WYL domain-containing protein n=1 Tax=Corallibacter vietnamensis TaxID=904130 RepID=A0ABP7H618_9FLAO
MATTKNALIRYKTIDKCLQNHFKKWTLDDLIAACSNALYDFEGRNINVSKRTIQLDIQLMRSDKLGYNAPIEVYDKKYYRYAESDYSIKNTPITNADMQVLSETIEMLKQFQDFSLFSELSGLFNKLEDQIHTQKNNKPAIIHLDKNDNLKGLKFLDELYQAILKEVVLIITYKSFKARHPNIIVFHPYLLKEYNNRWFVIGKPHAEDKLLTLALDRILALDYNFKLNYQPKFLDANSYYKNTIGVTVMPETHLKTVVFKIDSKNAPYVITKPFHSSQKLVEKSKKGSVIFSIDVHINYELERLILGFGESIEVLEPNSLRNRIKQKLNKAAKQYATR